MLTVLAYIAADRISQASGRHPVANPVLIAVVIVGSVLCATGTPHARYFEGARFVHVLLGPATVALALPIIRHRALIRRQWRAIVGAMVIGAGVGVISAAGLAKALGLSAGTVASIAPKSVTAAIAMGISEQLGGTPPLTAVLVISTGILGGILITPLMNLIRVKDYAARGFAAGLAAHGIGTAGRCRSTRRPARMRPSPWAEWARHSPARAVAAASALTRWGFFPLCAFPRACHKRANDPPTQDQPGARPALARGDPRFPRECPGSRRQKTRLRGIFTSTPPNA